MLTWLEINKKNLAHNIKVYRKIAPNSEIWPVIKSNAYGHGFSNIAKLLDTFGICIRAGHHCAQPILHRYNVKSVNRISLYFYNTKNEIDILYQSLLKVIKVLS